MGLVQALVVIPFGQFAVDVGSLWVLILIPLVTTILLTYSTQILYEAYAKSPKKRSYRTKDWKAKIRVFLQKELVRPVIIVILVFLIAFFIFYGIFSGLDSVITFVIAENIGAIAALIISVLLERRIVPPE